MRAAVAADVEEGAQAPVVAAYDEHRLACDGTEEPVARGGRIGRPTDDRPLPGEDALPFELPDVGIEVRAAGQRRFEGAHARSNAVRTAWHAYGTYAMQTHARETGTNAF